MTRLPPHSPRLGDRLTSSSLVHPPANFICETETPLSRRLVAPPARKDAGVSLKRSSPKKAAACPRHHAKRFQANGHTGEHSDTPSTYQAAHLIAAKSLTVRTCNQPAAALFLGSTTVMTRTVEESNTPSRGSRILLRKSVRNSFGRRRPKYIIRATPAKTN